MFEDDDLCTKLHAGKQDIEKGDLFVVNYKLRLAQLNKNNYAWIDAVDI